MEPTMMERAREALQANLDHRKVQDMPRKEVRRKVQIRHRIGKPFARIRSGIRTGTTPHFAMWMQDLKMKSALQNITIASLADRQSDLALAGAYKAIQRHGHFRNVWELTQATKAQLHDTPGLGPKRIAAIKADLASRHVAVKW